MAHADITFIRAESLTWVQSLQDTDGNIGTVVFKWGGTTISFKREQLDELLGVLHFITGRDNETTVLTNSDGKLSQVTMDSDGMVEFIPLLGVNA